MTMRIAANLVAVLAWLCAAAPAAAQSAPTDSSKVKPTRDPNQRVCETVQTIGTRLGAKKVCATRSEWAARRKEDQDAVDQAQRAAQIGCSTVGTLSGTPAC